MSRTDDRGAKLVVTLGVLAVVASFLVAVLPGLAPLPGSVLRGLANFAASVFGLGALAVLVAMLAVLRLAKDRRAAAPPAGLRPAEAATDRSGADTAFATDLAAATGTGRPGRDAETARAAVRSRLDELARETYRRVEGCEASTADRAVTAGEWTDDPVARDFLAEDGPGLSVRQWLRALLHPEGSFAYRVERTVAAIDRLDRGRPGAGDGRSPAADGSPGEDDRTGGKRTATGHRPTFGGAGPATGRRGEGGGDGAGPAETDGGRDRTGERTGPATGGGSASGDDDRESGPGDRTAGGDPGSGDGDGESETRDRPSGGDRP